MADTPKTFDIRQACGEAFLRDLQSFWDKNGAQLLRRVAEESPDAFVEIVASLTPVRVELSTAFEDLPDDELAAVIERLRRILHRRRSVLPLQ